MRVTNILMPGFSVFFLVRVLRSCLAAGIVVLAIRSYLPDEKRGSILKKLRIVDRDNVLTLSPLGNSLQHERAKRGEIDSFSDASRRRMLRVARAVSGMVKVMITLTYADIPTDGKKCKKQLNRFLYYIHELGHDYYWFMEFQRRKSVHYHIYTSKTIDKDELSSVWNKIVYGKVKSDEQLRHLIRGTRVEYIRKPHALAYYAGKYAAKKEQKIAPDFYKGLGRFWGRSRGLKGSEKCFEIESFDITLFNIKTRKLRDDAVFAKKGIDKYGTFITWDEDTKNKIKSVVDTLPHITYNRDV